MHSWQFLGTTLFENLWRSMYLAQKRWVYNRVAQTAFILFSGFLDLRPVSAASDLQPWIYGGLEIRIQLKNARLSPPNM
jgi:hypothetical protein